MKFKKSATFFAILLIIGCSSTSRINKKNEKAVNRVLGYNLVDEVIDKSGWVERHPMDTSIINFSYISDTLFIENELQSAREDERARLLSNLKGRCMNRDIQGIIDSLAIAMKKKDTVKIITTKTVYYEDERGKDKLKDTIKNKSISIAELNGRIYEKDLLLKNQIDIVKGLQKKYNIISWIRLIIVILCAATTVYFAVFYKRK